MRSVKLKLTLPGAGTTRITLAGIVIPAHFHSSEFSFDGQLDIPGASGEFIVRSSVAAHTGWTLSLTLDGKIFDEKGTTKGGEFDEDDMWLHKVMLDFATMKPPTIA